MGAESFWSVHFITEAERLAFADRDAYIADPAFVPLPPGLLDPVYLGRRSSLISALRSLGHAVAGDPRHRLAQPAQFATGAGTAAEFPSTSQVSIVDGEGNAVSMTTTIEDAFGSRLMTRGGFLLNNELTDFSFAPEVDGKPVANRVGPGKRPRSSMSPTIVYDRRGRVYAILGSAGGSLIINDVAKTLIAILDWKLDPQAAIALPNFGSRNGPIELERDTRIVRACTATRGAGARDAADRRPLRSAGDRAHAHRLDRRGRSPPRRRRQGRLNAMLLTEVFSAAVLLLLVIDPFGNVPIVIAALGNVEGRRRTRVVFRECVVAYVILLVFMLVGRAFLRWMQLSEVSLAIAGGIILFLIALRMVFKHPEGVFGDPPGTEPFVVPLAIPAIAGPSALATVMLMVSRDPSHRVAWIAALTVAMAITTLVLLAAYRLQRVLGERGMIAVERLMGLVLTALAVQMLLDGVRTFVAALAQGG